MLMAHKIADQRPVSPRRLGAGLVGHPCCLHNGGVAAHVVHEANETVVVYFDIVVRKHSGLHAFLLA